MHLSRRHLGTLFTALALAVGAHAQPFPSKNMRLVVPTPAGSSVDIAARLIGEGLRFGVEGLEFLAFAVGALVSLPASRIKGVYLALVTLALPSDYDIAFIEAIYHGLNQLALKHAVAIAGGETTTNPRILISIALLGTVPRSRQVLRSGAKAGDAIFVTGTLGGSLAGRHLDFEPRLTEARWLAERFTLHAMIDLSDGLGDGVRRLAEALDEADLARLDPERYALGPAAVFLTARDHGAARSAV